MAAAEEVVTLVVEEAAAGAAWQAVNRAAAADDHPLPLPLHLHHPKQPLAASRPVRAARSEVTRARGRRMPLVLFRRRLGFRLPRS